MQGNIRTSLFRPELIKRIVIYGLLTLLLGSAQCSFFPLLSICPSTPDLIMGMLLAIVLIDSDKSAAVTAIAAGFFIDAVGGGAIALSPLIYCVFVLFISMFSGKMLTSFPSYALLMIPTLIYRGLATAACMAIERRALVSLPEILSTVGPELICTAIVCIPLYFAVKLCAIPLETHGKFTF